MPRKRVEIIGLGDYGMMVVENSPNKYNPIITIEACSELHLGKSGVRQLIELMQKYLRQMDEAGARLEKR